MTQRQEKVAQRIKEEVSSIIHDEIKDPRIGFITITKVELTPDLRFGKILYSVLGGEEKRKNAKAGLESAYKYVRKLLGDRIKLRYTPDIAFKIDTSAEYSIKMSQIFDKLEEERKQKEGQGNEQ